MRYDRIQTKITDKWKNVQYATGWRDIIKVGWKFVCLKFDGSIAMERKGYINLFRHNPKYKSVEEWQQQLKKKKKVDGK